MAGVGSRCKSVLWPLTVPILNSMLSRGITLLPLIIDVKSASSMPSNPEEAAANSPPCSCTLLEALLKS